MEGESKNVMKDQQFLLGLFGGIAVVAIIGMIIMGIILIGQKGAKNNNVAATTGTDTTGQQQAQQQAPAGPATEPVTAPGVATFSQKKGATVCKEGGKPLVYLFSTTWCPHCKWVKDTFDKVAKEYVDAGKIKAYHWEVDTFDDTLTATKETAVPADQEAVYQEFNPGGSIPTFVIGCKYFRVGNGYESKNDLVAEEKELKAAIDAVLK